jgi:gliding motility-associated-like protein
MNNCKFYLIASLFLISIKNRAQDFCQGAYPLCGNTGLSGLVSGFSGNTKVNNSNSCGNGLTFGVLYKINFKKGGTFGFDIIIPGLFNVPLNDPAFNVDFYVFGPIVDCDNIGQAVRCSVSDPNLSPEGQTSTGMNNSENDTSESYNEGNGYLKMLDVKDNETYYILFDFKTPGEFISLGAGVYYEISFTGTARISYPSIETDPLDINQCYPVGFPDNAKTVDLTQNSSKIIGSQTNVSVSYFTSQEDAVNDYHAIDNPKAYVIPRNSQMIFAKITNTETDCYNFTDFIINVIDAPHFSATESYVCDNDIDGDDSNGKALFDLKKVSADIFINQKIEDLTINYYLTKNDAENNTNQIQNSFYNTIPNKQSVFVKATNSSNCSETQEIALVVKALPPKSNVSLVQCDSSQNGNGLVLYNLNEANLELTNNDPNLSTRFFLTNNDAVNNSKPLNDTFLNTINPQTISVLITDSNTKCSSVGSLTLKTKPIIPIIYPINPLCDDDGLEDGKHTFDLTTASIPFTNIQNIKYYLNQNDALLEKDPITAPTSYTNTTPYQQEIYARIEENNQCLEIHNTTLRVNKLPDIITTGSAIVCENLPNYYVNLDSGFKDGFQPGEFTFEWSKNNNIVSNEPTLDVNSEGTYKVVVTDKLNCSKTRTLNVTPSKLANITSITVVDLSQNEINTITVNATGNGEYEYSLDNPNGPFHESNIFDDVTAGIHEIYVNDKKGCGLANRTVAVLGALKFFTPNGDSFNEYWNIKGLNSSSNKNSIIFIFDRYGKLLKQITPSSNGWDGTYMGIPMPTDDYWYIVKLEDGRETKGHFSLKR